MPSENLPRVGRGPQTWSEVCTELSRTPFRIELLFQFKPRTAETHSKPEPERIRTLRGSLADVTAAGLLLLLALATLAAAIAGYLLAGRELLRRFSI